MNETFDKCYRCGFHPSYKIDELDQSIFFRCRCNGGFGKDLKLAIEVWNKLNEKHAPIWYAHIVKSGFLSKHYSHHVNLLKEILNNRKIEYVNTIHETSIIIELYNLSLLKIEKIKEEVIDVIFGTAGIMHISVPGGFCKEVKS
jgi:hypothetical protein